MAALSVQGAKHNTGRGGAAERIACMRTGPTVQTAEVGTHAAAVTGPHTTNNRNRTLHGIFRRDGARTTHPRRHGNRCVTGKVLAPLTTDAGTERQGDRTVHEHDDTSESAETDYIMGINHD